MSRVRFVLKTKSIHEMNDNDILFGILTTGILWNLAQTKFDF